MLKYYRLLSHSGNQALKMTEIKLNERWEKKWHAGDTRWHKSMVNPRLEQYFPVVSQDESLHGKTVFVPFCGKTLDMKWFYEQGMKVVGVEAIEMPILEFFEENNLSFQKDLINDYEVFKAKEWDLKIFKGNLFQFGVNDFEEKFDFLWDRGALVAVDEEYQQQYVNLIGSLMKKNAIGLLEVSEYDKTRRSEQPFVIFLDDLTSLCKDKFIFEELGRDYEGHDVCPYGFERSLVVYKLRAM